MNRKHTATAAVLLVAVLTGTSWAGSSGLIGLGIQPGSQLPGGGLATVTPLDGNVTVVRGAAHTIDGIELFRLDLANARLSDQLDVHVLLLNPTDMDKVFGNPNAYLDVAIWYEDPDGNHTLEDGTNVSRDPGDDAEARMTRSSGHAVLQPSVPGQTTLYILASATVPGGNPSGAQDQARPLSFHTEVRA